MQAAVALNTSVAPFAAQRVSRQQKRSSARLVPRALARDEQQQPSTAVRLAGGLLGAAAAALALASPALAREPFLLSTGAKGPLAVEEEQLFRLREEKEQEALKELEGLKLAAESEIRSQREQDNDQLCVTPFGVDVVGITEFVALTGALVGGISARRRKQELERLNEQLRTINAQLRQQARAGTLYAPGLTYAPPMLGRGDNDGGNGAPAAGGAATMAQPAAAAVAAPPQFSWPPPEPSPAAQEAAEAAAAAVARAAGTATAAAAAPVLSVTSIDEDDMRPEARQCLQALKEGKRLLKEQSAGAAMVRFEKALMLSKCVGDRVRERRAMRGLAASARMQGQYRQAIKHLERVLEISNDIRDHVGDADAYGTIADIYTDLGDFERAGQYYDRYIEQLGKEGPV